MLSELLASTDPFSAEQRVSGSVVGVRTGPGVEEETNHLGRPRRAAWVDLLPVRVAGVEQRGPALNLIDGDRCRRVKSEHLGQLGCIAENGGGRHAVAGDVGDGVENRGGLAHSSLDRRGHERFGLPLGTGDVGLHGGLETRPAGESKLASDDQLGRRQGDDTLELTLVVANEALERGGLVTAGAIA